MVADQDTECTILLPRRAFSSRLARILHDRTADRIASAVSVVPNVSATIVPFNLVDLQRGQALEEEAQQVADATPSPDEAPPNHPKHVSVMLPADQRLAERSSGALAISELEWRKRARVAGRVRSVRVQTGPGAENLECTLSDGSGSLLVVFQGRPTVPGIEPGARLVLEGMVGSWHQQLAILNPDYELIAGPSGEHEEG